MGGDSGALETKTELGGITVGGEYTMGDMTFGVMGNFGTGDVEGEGDNDGVKNDVDYYGVQGYAAKRMGQFNLVGQMGLMTTKNDVTSADGDSADIDATIFTIGARGEMAFQISKSCQAVPYVGLNYLRVATDGYNTAKGLSVDDMDQNLVSMPIGVAFSGNMDLASGWTLRPTVDVAYVHTFGDTDVEATTKFGDAAINTNLDVWSENVGRVSFGLEARKDALSFGGQIGGAFGDNDHREFYGQLLILIVSLSAAFSLSSSGAAGIPASGILRNAGGFLYLAIRTSTPRRIRHWELLRFALRRTLHQLRSFEGYT